jgi:hypothetical protein
MPRDRRSPLLALGVAAFLLPFTSGAQEKLPLPSLAPDRIQALRGCLNEHGLPPEDYVLSQFEDHDVVFLGEYHCIEHVGLFIQSLVPRLYERGIHALAVEHARRVDQPLIDSLLAGDTYDEALAREIVFRQYLHHGMREYVDVFRAAWELDRSLSPDQPRFTILGVNNAPDWSYVKTPEDRDRDEVKRKVWHGETEEDWAEVVLDRVARGEKVLVYSGMHHAFTEYAMPIVNGATGEFIRLYPERMGNYVYERIGKRAVTIALHSPWPDVGGEFSRYAVDGAIDALMQELGPEAYPVGFDTRGSPFGDLTAGGDCLYAQGHEGFTLSDWCDGYVFHRPISEFEGMTPIPDFVNQDNLERARAISWDPRFRDASIGMFQFSLLQSANIKGKFRRFH